MRKNVSKDSLKRINCYCISCQITFAYSLYEHTFKLKIFYALTTSYSSWKTKTALNLVYQLSVHLSEWIMHLFEGSQTVLSYDSFPGVICQACSLSSQEKEIICFLFFLFYPFIWETFPVNWACLHMCFQVQEWERKFYCPSTSLVHLR